MGELSLQIVAKPSVHEGEIFRALLEREDTKTKERLLKKQNPIDVVFISNMRDTLDRERFGYFGAPEGGHFDGHRIFCGDIVGRIRFIDSLAEDLVNPHGRKKAKEQFLSAVGWAHRQGAKVVLLAAGLKRILPPKELLKLQSLYPKIVFTIGDNGTSGLLIANVLSLLAEKKMSPSTDKIILIGPAGHIGKPVLRVLLASGYEVAGISTNPSSNHIQTLLKEFKEAKNFKIFSKIEEAKKASMVIACSHHEKVRLKAQNIREQGIHVVVDASAPANFSSEEYNKVKGKVLRVDAGTAYNKNLKYVLGKRSYDTLYLSEGTTFGCFAESMALAYLLQNEKGSALVKKHDWLSVNRGKITLINDTFSEMGFGLPKPTNFGQPI